MLLIPTFQILNSINKICILPNIMSPKASHKTSEWETTLPNSLYVSSAVCLYGFSSRRWSCHGIQQYQLKWEWFLTWIHGWGRWAWAASPWRSQTSMPLMGTTRLGWFWKSEIPIEMLWVQLQQVLSFHES